MHIKKSQTNIIRAVSWLTALVTIALWQFYLFVAFKDSNGRVDVQGGTFHLWVALGLVLIACVVGFFVFSVFLRRDKYDELHITS